MNSAEEIPILKAEIRHLERRCSLLTKPPLVQSMIIWAFRYCLGRKSYAVSDCVTYLLEHWKLLEEHTKELIFEETREAFRRNDYGMEMDKEQWERILRRKEDELDERKKKEEEGT